MSVDLQIENGKYTRISNKIIEDLIAIQITGTELKICLFIIRMTYGYNKKKSSISVSKIVEAINCSDRYVRKSLKSLRMKNIILEEDNGIKKPKIIGFNKYSHQWTDDFKPEKTGSIVHDELKDRIQSSGDIGSRVQVMRNCRSGAIYKDNLKDNIKDIASYQHFMLIIHHLNFRTKKNFGHTNKSTVRLISARFNEGRTKEDFIRVIDVKCDQWLNDPKMSAYLRPSTLFNATNFENYLNEQPKGIDHWDSIAKL